MISACTVVISELQSVQNFICCSSPCVHKFSVTNFFPSWCTLHHVLWKHLSYRSDCDFKSSLRMSCILLCFCARKLRNTLSEVSVALLVVLLLCFLSVMLNAQSHECVFLDLHMMCDVMRAVLNRWFVPAYRCFVWEFVCHLVWSPHSLWPKLTNSCS